MANNISPDFGVNGVTSEEAPLGRLGSTDRSPPLVGAQLIGSKELLRESVVRVEEERLVSACRDRE